MLLDFSKIHLSGVQELRMRAMFWFLVSCFFLTSKESERSSLFIDHKSIFFTLSSRQFHSNRAHCTVIQTQRRDLSGTELPFTVMYTPYESSLCLDTLIVWVSTRTANYPPCPAAALCLRHISKQRPYVKSLQRLAQVSRKKISSKSLICSGHQLRHHRCVKNFL